MSAFSLYRMIMNVANVAKELETAGMRIEIGDDFAAYRLLRNAQQDRAPIYPMFDVASSYVDKSNAFWICGFNEQDELVHSIELETSPNGRVTLDWDGTDSDGMPLPDGSYRIEVTATDLEGEPMAIALFRALTIDGVNFGPGGVSLAPGANGI